MRYLVTLCCLFLLGCSPGPTPEPAPTQTSSTPTATTTKAPEVPSWSLHLTPGPSISVSQDGLLKVRGETGSLAFQLPAETAKELWDEAKAFEPQLESDRIKQPTHFGVARSQPKGELWVYRAKPKLASPELIAWTNKVLALLPQTPGNYGSHALGTLEYSDLEGGFHQLITPDEKLFLNGTIPPELHGQQVLISGSPSEAPNIGMTGPSYEVTGILEWPLEGMLWKIEERLKP